MFIFLKFDFYFFINQFFETMNKFLFYKLDIIWYNSCTISKVLNPS
jgi:hypothetical protein